MSHAISYEDKHTDSIKKKTRAWKDKEAQRTYQVILPLFVDTSKVFNMG